MSPGLGIHYWFYSINFITYFLFEQDTNIEETFKGTFKFNLDNMRIEGEPEGADSFTVELKAGKRVQR